MQLIDRLHQAQTLDHYPRQVAGSLERREKGCRICFAIAEETKQVVLFLSSSLQNSNSISYDCLIRRTCIGSSMETIVDTQLPCRSSPTTQSTLRIRCTLAIGLSLHARPHAVLLAHRYPALLGLYFLAAPSASRYIPIMGYLRAYPSETGTFTSPLLLDRS